MRELLAAGLPVCGTHENPREGIDDGLPPERWAIDWATPPTPAQLAAAAAVIAAHDRDGDAKEDSADATALSAALSAIGTGTAPERIARVEAILLRLVARLRKRGGA